MTALLNMLLMNAVVVIPLAGAVTLVTRWACRPALTHVMWVLVLLKLITPPFFQLPFSVPSPFADTSVADASCAAGAGGGESHGSGGAGGRELHGVASATGEPDIDVKALASGGSSCEEPGASTVEPPGDSTSNAVLIQQDARTAAAPDSAAAATLRAWLIDRALPRVQALAQPWLIRVTLLVWGLGTAGWLGRQLFRAVQFRQRIARCGYGEPVLQEQTRRLAEQFGLRRVPRVVIVEAQLSPMLWGYGSRVHLLFPADLASWLDEEARGTLLAHELAHYRRGDQWIRLLELLVTGIFWWHPIVWMARQRIEEAEEECCDAWVIQEMPNAPRRYAEALLDTIDFLCDAPVAIPPLASGLGPAAFLRRRLTRIMEGGGSEELTSRQRCGVLLIAVLALPLQPFVLGSTSRAPQLSLESEETSPIRAATLETPPPEPVTASVVPERDSQAASEPAVSPPPPSLLSRAGAGRAARGERIWGTAVSPQGHYAVHITTARRVGLADLANGIQTDLSAQGITSVAFFPDGESFVAGGADGSVAVWSAKQGKALRQLIDHSAGVRSVAVSPQGGLVAVGSVDGLVQLVDPRGEQPVVELARAEAAVNCVRFSPDGRRLAVAMGDWNVVEPGQIAILDLRSGRAECVLTCDSAPGAVNFVSNDELIVGEWNGHTSLWNLVTRHVVGSALAEKSLVNASSFSPDNPGMREVTFVATPRAGSPSIPFSIPSPRNTRAS